MGAWSEEKMRGLFDQALIDKVCNIPIPTTVQCDRVVWAKGWWTWDILLKRCIGLQNGLDKIGQNQNDAGFGS